MIDLLRFSNFATTYFFPTMNTMNKISEYSDRSSSETVKILPSAKINPLETGQNFLPRKCIFSKINISEINLREN